MFPKRTYVRSPALLEACRKLACQHCGADDGTVCAAHSNWGVHGKGKAIKADDNRVAALCHRCHSALDQGGQFSEAGKRAIWWRAHVRTVRALVALALWPKKVPAPDIENCPFDSEGAYA